MFRLTPVFWIIAGLILAGLEMVLPGFILLWFGIAALITGIAAFFVTEPLLQLVLFAVLAGVLVTMSQYISRRITRVEPEPTGANRLIGVPGKVIAAIRPPEPGRVKILGEEWTATAAVEIDADRPVIILQVVGTRLTVTPAELPPASESQNKNSEKVREQ